MKTIRFYDYIRTPIGIKHVQDRLELTEDVALHEIINNEVGCPYIYGFGFDDDECPKYDRPLVMSIDDVPSRCDMCYLLTTKEFGDDFTGDNK